MQSLMRERFGKLGMSIKQMRVLFDACTLIALFYKIWKMHALGDIPADCVPSPLPFRCNRLHISRFQSRFVLIFRLYAKLRRVRDMRDAEHARISSLPAQLRPLLSRPDGVYRGALRANRFTNTK